MFDSRLGMIHQDTGAECLKRQQNQSTAVIIYEELNSQLYLTQVFKSNRFSTASSCQSIFISRCECNRKKKKKSCVE